MRLLKAEDLTFREFLGSNIPPYAIVSHRWGDEELSYGSFLKDKEQYQRALLQSCGWTKIIEAARLALESGLDWIWLDTICINKDSSAELSEAINSMYLWYSRSRICFVFLPDVHNLVSCTCELSDKSVSRRQPTGEYLHGMRNIVRTVFPFYEMEFNRSCWFRRSWTLQELLAPRHLVFFNSSYETIGTTASLSSLIQVATSIPSKYLKGAMGRLSEKPCIAERMRWASFRTASRVEDEAYSLLGLFDVSMPLLYGEGSRAFRRLQIEILRESSDESVFAWFNTVSDENLLARSASSFSKLMVEEIPYLPRKHYEHTNMGIRFNVPIYDPDCTYLLPSKARATVHRERAAVLLLPLNCRGAYKKAPNEIIRGPVALLLRVSLDQASLRLNFLKGRRSYKGLCILENENGEGDEHLSDNSTRVKDMFSNLRAFTGRWIYADSGEPAHFDLTIGTDGSMSVEEYSIYLDA